MRLNVPLEAQPTDSSCGPTCLQAVYALHGDRVAGLSATFLYRSSRENSKTNEDQDVRGEPTGHFVVLKGYHRRKQTVVVADAYEQNQQNPWLPAGYTRCRCPG